jgi:uncharacterized SAM-binding protein YcdF (DUF218 family)
VNDTLHPLVVLLLAPLLLLVVVAQAFWAAWTAPSVPLGAEAFAAWVAARCPVDAILVLGAAQYDGVPSPPLERRLAGAARLYEAGCAPLVVVSGGGRAGDRTTEGDAGVRWLAGRGLPPTALVAEAARPHHRREPQLQHGPGARRALVDRDGRRARGAGSLRGRAAGLAAEFGGVATGGGRIGYVLREVAATVAYRLGAFR